MKKLLLAVAALTLLAGLATAQTNEIGLYTTELAESSEYNGAPGQIPCYAVVTNPVNDGSGAPIMQIGGFEFRLEVPANAFILFTELPPSSTNFASPPDFFVGTSVPVIDGRATVLSLTLGEFSGTPTQIFMSPVPTIASIPDAIAITDANDGFAISQAYPASGGFEFPVFGLWTTVVDTEDASWGDVKSLYR